MAWNTKPRLTTQAQGLLAVLYGGTGLSTIASGGLLYASALDTLSVRTIGSSGDVLTVSGGFPVWAATSGITVPYTSISSVPTATVLGRNTAGTGAAEALSTIPSAVQDNITRTGALNSGSITSGFGAIDVGTDAITGGVGTFTKTTAGVGLTVTNGGATPKAIYVYTDATAAYVANDAGVTDAWMRLTSGGVAFGASGTLMLFADSTGVGVRATSLGGLFEVKGAGTGRLVIDQWVSDTSYAGMNLSGPVTATNYNLLSGISDTNLYINRVTGKNIYFTENGGASQMAFLTGGNFGLGSTTNPGTGSFVLIFGDGTAPSSMGANTAGLYADDDGSGNIRMYGINEDGVSGPLGLVYTKSTTGDPTGREGLFVINTFDNTFKVYADAGWRTLASGW